MRPADRAWLVLGAGVAIWDIACDPDEMLSAASSRYTKARPLLWRLVVIYVAGHLIHCWPERVDLLSGLARAFGR